MKTIQISDELYNDLLDIAKEYVTQDKRHQSEPRMFTVMSKVWTDCTEDTMDEYYYIDTSSGDYTVYNEEEAKIWCKKNNCFFDDEEDRLINNMGDELERRCRRWVESVDTPCLINPFFTAKYCEVYIHNDRHNLRDKNAKSYAFTPTKNFEMTTIAKLLTELGEKDK